MKRRSGLISQAAHYRQLLLREKSELLAEIGAEFLPPGERGRIAEDDRAPVAHDEFISLEIQRRGCWTLRQIDAALDRLATGDFGVCADCGEPISPRRLDAIPWAAYCIQCQEHRGHSVENLDERAA